MKRKQVTYLCKQVVRDEGKSREISSLPFFRQSPFDLGCCRCFVFNTRKRREAFFFSKGRYIHWQLLYVCSCRSVIWRRKCVIVKVGWYTISFFFWLITRRSDVIIKQHLTPVKIYILGTNRYENIITINRNF